MTDAIEDYLFAGGRAAEPLHHALLSRRRLPQHISDRGGGGQDHEDWWLEDGVDSIGATSSGPVGGKRECRQSYADDSELPLPPRVRLGNVQEVWVRHPSTGPVVNYKYDSKAQRSMGETTDRRRMPHPNPILTFNGLRY